MMFNVEQFITNTQKQYVARVSATYDNLESAKVNYFGVCQAMLNADDVYMAVIKIVDEYGNDVEGYREVIDNTAKPEPTPVPTV